MMLPRETSLSHWAHSLIIDFPRDNIPLLRDETDWKKWGNMLIQENSFSRSGAPGPERYDDWKTWALDVFRTMTNF